MTDAVELTKALRGRWHGSYGTARCPAHDDFSPSLSISVGADSKTLVKCHAGCPQARVIDALRELGLWNGAGANSAHVETARNPRDFAPKPNHTNGERALRIWDECVPASGTLVEVYLASRSITIPIPDVLRFHPGLKHPDGGEWPAMVARVDRGGEHVAIHRTFLKPDGSGKAPGPRPKLMLGPCAGGAARLSEAVEKLAVGEGIETCLSVLQATGQPVWAALSTSGLASLDLPKTVQQVVILADKGDAGEKAAVDAGRRWQDAGLKVKIARPRVGADFNDALRAGGTAYGSIMDDAEEVPTDVVKLAKIDNKIEQGLAIKKEAKRLGCSTQDIKAEIKRFQITSGSECIVEQPHWQVEPWPTPVDGGDLVDALSAGLRSTL